MGLNARLETEVHLFAAEPGTSLLRLAVTSRGAEVAYEVAPLSLLREGFRCLPLRDPRGTRIAHCCVLLHIRAHDPAPMPNGSNSSSELVAAREQLQQLQALCAEQAAELEVLRRRVHEIESSGRPRPDEPPSPAKPLSPGKAVVVPLTGGSSQRERQQPPGPAKTSSLLKLPQPPSPAKTASALKLPQPPSPAKTASALKLPQPPSPAKTSSVVKLPPPVSPGKPASQRERQGPASPGKPPSPGIALSQKERQQGLVALSKGTSSLVHVQI